ncbi:MAG: anti-sigma factor antagonist [Deltaproteobacteria bacterium]|nr:anti-sigma factor antagonist [Deltaproteobacteria bacterium]
MFEYTITHQTSRQCITVKGRIDALSASELQEVFQQLILAGGRLLLADLSGVHYISSAGLRIFILAQKELKKVGGEMILSGLSTQVLDVFKMSGFEKLFRIVPQPDALGNLVDADVETASGRRIKTDQVSIDYFEKDVPAGSAFVIGSTDKMEKAAYGEADVVPVAASRMRWGCGMAALGDSFDDYRNLFGEAMVINGNFFYYPAVRHPSVDFLLRAHSDPRAAYKFLHGFGVSGGDYRYLLSFKAENGSVDLASLLSAFLAVSKAKLIGVTVLAESKGLWGMNIRKPPVAALQSSAPESIFQSCSFPEWFDFPVEPAYAGSIVAATGIAAANPQALPGPLRSLFSGGAAFHLHGGIFAKAPIGVNAADLDNELIRVFNELSAIKIQHLIGQSRFSAGMAGIVEIEV